VAESEAKMQMHAMTHAEIKILKIAKKIRFKA